MTIWLKKGKKNQKVSHHIQDRGSTAVLQSVSTELKLTMWVQHVVTSFTNQYYRQLCQQPNPPPQMAAIPSPAKIKYIWETEKTAGSSQASPAPSTLPWQTTTLNSSASPRLVSFPWWRRSSNGSILPFRHLPVVPGLTSFLKTGFALAWARAHGQVCKQAPCHSKMLQGPARRVFPFTGL